VVDDERDLLSAVCGVLEDEGYDVIECSNARQALEHLATRKPDIALIDVMMPVMAGPELVAIMHEDPRLDGLPIVMMSAVEANIDREAVAAFLKKPFKLARLLETIKSLTR
jgi:CheY-like chemotaxis protein